MASRYLLKDKSTLAWRSVDVCMKKPVFAQRDMIGPMRFSPTRTFVARRERIWFDELSMLAR